MEVSYALTWEETAGLNLKGWGGVPQLGTRRRRLEATRGKVTVEDPERVGHLDLASRENCSSGPEGLGFPPHPLKNTIPSMSPHVLTTARGFWGWGGGEAGDCWRSET